MSPKCPRSMPIVVHLLLPRLSVGYGRGLHCCCSTKEDILPLLGV